MASPGHPGRGSRSDRVPNHGPCNILHPSMVLREEREARESRHHGTNSEHSTAQNIAIFGWQETVTLSLISIITEFVPSAPLYIEQLYNYKISHDFSHPHTEWTALE